MRRSAAVTLLAAAALLAPGAVAQTVIQTWDFDTTGTTQFMASPDLTSFTAASIVGSVGGGPGPIASSGSHLYTGTGACTVTATTNWPTTGAP